MKRILIILSLILLSAHVHAAATRAPAVIYEIEALAFKNTLPDLEGGELWTNQAKNRPDSAVTGAITLGDKTPAGAYFDAAARALESSGHHPILARWRWQQSAEAKSESKPVRITNDETQLTGGLRLYLSRFLYLDVDLMLRETTKENAAVDASMLQKYHIDEHRRIKTSEINYFDHPKFGVLVRVTQVGK